MTHVLKAELQRLRFELKDLRARQVVVAAAGHGAQSPRSWVLSERDKITLMLLYSECHYDITASVKFLEVIGRRRRYPQLSATEAERIVENIFLAIDLDCVAESIANAEDSLAIVARGWAREYELVCWIRNANACGVAPSACAILNRARAICKLPACALGTCHGAPTRQARSWLSRFRKRWDLRIGKVQHIENISNQEAEQKALFCGECDAKRVAALREGSLCWVLALWVYFFETRAQRNNVSESENRA